MATPGPLARLNSSEFQNQLADALMRGITAYFAKQPPLSRERIKG